MFQKLLVLAVTLILGQMALAAPKTPPSPRKKLPLWELGMGFLAFRADHYRGANQYEKYLWPLPYFIYRGNRLQAESSFIQGKLLDFGTVRFDLSVSAGLPVKSKENRARQGMSNIYPSFEVGPIMIVNLWEHPDELHKVQFRWPVRAVFATNLRDFEHIGYYTIPYLNLTSRPQDKTWGIGSDFSVGLMGGSTQYHDYFYGVSPAFATPHRPSYEGKTGYSGLQLTWILSKRFKRALFFPFARYDILTNTAFDDSPLIRRKNYFMGGLGFIYFFHSSEKEQKNKAIR